MQKYSEIIIQYGYIILFAQAFPLAPFFSILTNLLEMKGAMNMMAFYQKRYIAQGSSGIGSWRSIAEVTTSLNLNISS